jgi:hypothetical protein
MSLIVAVMRRVSDLRTVPSFRDDWRIAQDIADVPRTIIKSPAVSSLPIAGMAICREGRPAD